MHKRKIVPALILLILGLIGISSLLTTPISLPEEALVQLREQFTSQQIRLLILVNPTIFLLLALIAGINLYKKTGLDIPVIDKISGNVQEPLKIADLLRYGVFGGLLAGILLSIVIWVFYPMFPPEFIKLSKETGPSPVARFLYGGLTEEIIMRFGLMTLLVWVIFKIIRDLNAMVYWIAIILSALVFALGHLPSVMPMGPSNIVVLYILIGNTIGGIEFGWLYWKKGLESAMIAHMFTHVVLLFSEEFLI